MAINYYVDFDPLAGNNKALDSTAKHALDVDAFLATTDGSLAGDYQVYGLVRDGVTANADGSVSIGELAFGVADANTTNLMRGLVLGTVFQASVTGYVNDGTVERPVAAHEVSTKLGIFNAAQISGVRGVGTEHKFTAKLGNMTVIEDISPSRFDDGRGKTTVAVNQLTNTHNITKEPGAGARQQETSSAGPETDVRYYMKVTQAGETNWVEIDSFGFAIRTPVFVEGLASGSPAGRAQFSTLDITRAADDASARFAYLATTEATAGRVDIQAFKNFGTEAAPNWLLASEFSFANVPNPSGQQLKPFVGSAVMGGETGAGLQAETLSFNVTDFRETVYTYTPGTSTPITPNEFKWSTAKNSTSVTLGDEVPDAPVNTNTGALTTAMGTTATQYFLKFESFGGASQVEGHLHQYQLNSFDLDVANRLLTIMLPANGDGGHLVTRVGTGTLSSELELFAENDSGLRTRFVFSDYVITSVSNHIEREGGGTWQRVVEVRFDGMEWDADTSSVGGKLIDLDPLRARATMSDQNALLGGKTSFAVDNSITDFETGQRVFMRIGASDGSTDWLEIEEFNFDMFRTPGTVGGGTYHAEHSLLFIQRFVDDASAKLGQLALKSGLLNLDLSIWDGGGADQTWRQVGQYRFEGADIVSVRTEGTPINEEPHIETLQVDFTAFREKLLTFRDGTSVSEASWNFEQNTPTGPALTSHLPPVNVENGNLDYPFNGADPLINPAHSQAGRVFLAFGAGTGDGLDPSTTNSGDQELDVHFSQFNTWFSVNAHELVFEDGGQIKLTVTLGNMQHTPAIDALLTSPSGTSSTGAIRVFGVVARDGGATSDVEWTLRASQAHGEFVSVDSGGDRTYVLTLAPSTGDTLKYSVLESSNGSHAGAGQVEGLFTRTATGYTSTGLDFNNALVQDNFGNAWGTRGGSGANVGEDDLRYRMQVGNTGQWVEIDGFRFEPGRATAEPFELEVVRPNGGPVSLHQAAVGTVISDIEIEVFLGNRQYYGLSEFHFKTAKLINVAYDGQGNEVLTYQFTHYSNAVQQYVPSPDARTLVVPVDTNGVPLKSSHSFYSTSASILPDPAAPPVFTGLANPVSVTGGSSFARSAPAFGGESFAVMAVDEYFSVQLAADEAAPGSTINVEPGATGTDVVLHTQDLTFNLAAGVNLNIAMNNELPPNGSVRIVNVTVTGDGTSTIVGNDADNTIQGGSGIDKLNGGLGNDFLYGGGGNDTLTDGLGSSDEGQDHLFGEDGDDTIVIDYVLTGNEYDGGTGSDTLDVRTDSGYGNSPILMGAEFVNQGSTFRSFENYLGSSSNEHVIGSADSNKLYGYDGTDTLEGLGGADELSGGAGNDTLTGGDGNDVLIDDDGAGVDSLDGGANDDRIRVDHAIAGETFAGGDGVDTLDFSQDTRDWQGANGMGLGVIRMAWGATFSGFENVRAGVGNDSVVGSDAANELYGGGGNDYLDGGLGDDKLLGEGGDDELSDGNGSEVDSAGADELDGGSGNDLIRANYANFGDIYDGGADVDTLDISDDDSDFVVNLSGLFSDVRGNYFIAWDAYFYNFENVIGGEGSHTITGSDGNNFIDAGAGNDFIDAGGGDDIVEDRDNPLNTGDNFTLGAGADILRLFGGSVGTYGGGADSDTIDISGWYNPGTNLTGANKLDLSSPTFTSMGATFAGFENVIGGGSNDEVIGTGGANVIDGRAGTDTINAGAGNDTITDADTAFDTIDGGADNDLVVIVGAGNGNYNGGSGSDTLDLSRAIESFTYEYAVYLGNGASFTVETGTYTSFENLIANNRGVDVYGSGEANDVTGGTGYDIVYAAGGADIIRDADAGLDELYGEGGDDTFLITRATDGDAYDGGEGAGDLLDLGGHNLGFDFSRQLKLDGTGSVLVRNFEKVVGTGFADWIVGAGVGEDINGGGGLDDLFGNGGDDILEGGAGGDVLDGGTGNNTAAYRLAAAQADGTTGVTVSLANVADNTGEAVGDTFINIQNLMGSAFHDILIGSSGINRLDGGAGNDRLIGGLGKDYYTGGTGADTFVLNGTTDSVAGNDRDVITDFGTDDIIDMSMIDANSTLANKQGFTFIGAGSADRNVAQGQLKYYQVGSNTYIVGNVGPDNDADFQIELTGLKSFSTDNFLGLGRALLNGTGNADVLKGTVGADVLNALGGTDRIIGGLGKDTLTGGAAADTFVLNDITDSLAGAERDVITDFETIDKIDLTAIDANGSLAGHQGFTFMGYGSADRIVGQGQLKYYQTAGNTYIVGNTGTGAEGNFQIELTGLKTLTVDNFLGISRAVLNGTGAAETIRGTAGDDVLAGLGGKDTLTGFAGADQFVYRNVTDSAAGAATRDVITDFDAADRIDFTTLDANSTLAGLQGFTFLGYGSADQTIGQGQLKYYQVGGNTYLVAGVNADTQADIQIELTGAKTLTTDSFLGLRNAIVTGSSAAQTLRGTAGDDVITGLGGKDTLFGLGGSDRFVYNNATESAAGAATRDVIADFDATDRIDFTTFDANSTLAGLQGFTFLGYGSADQTIGQGQLKYYQVGGNTYLVAGVNADTQADIQIELTGAKTLTTESFLGLGKAILTGTSGADRLVGTANAGDVLTGLGGADTLIGLGGKDTLSGGAGADKFIYTAVADSVVGADRDVITDWDVSDKLSFKTMDANLTLADLQSFVFDGSGSADRVVAQGHIKYYQTSGNTYIVGNVTADNQADFQIELTGLHTFTGSNFELI